MVGRVDMMDDQDNVAKYCNATRKINNKTSNKVRVIDRSSVSRLGKGSLPFI